MSSRGKQRLDLVLVERGLAETRSQAQALVLAGRVYCGEQRLDKPGTQVRADIDLCVRAGPRFVSRGGAKLKGALSDLAFDVAGTIAVDVGAATGGFSDCLLQHGSEKIYAVDVGQGLLANKLVQDPRVVVMDKTNARYLSADSFPDPINLVVVDASFIGIDKLAPALFAMLIDGGHLIAMIKPQFEVGRDAARRSRGVIRDPNLREQALAGARSELEKTGFQILGECDSQVPGPKGNVERFMLAQRGSHE